MKKFFKKYLWLIIVFIVSSILTILGTLAPICFVIGTLAMGCSFLVIAYYCRKKYKEQKNYVEDDMSRGIFDATKYDYDEDVYVFDVDKATKKKQIKKTFFSSLSASTPTVICIMFGVGLIIISITMLIKVVI